MECDYNSDFRCDVSILETNLSLNLDMISVSIRCSTALSDSLSTKFPNLRAITLQFAEKFTVFRFCPQLTNISILNFNVNSDTKLSVFDDLRTLSELKSFKFGARNMHERLYAPLFQALPKGLIELSLQNFNCQDILETFVDSVCEFERLEKLQSNWGATKISSLRVC